MINELFRELSSLPQVEAIALGGSRAGVNFDESSDYDIYLYCTGPVPEEARRDILSRYCSYLEIGNQFWELEDNCVLNDGVDMDILYRDLDAFTEGVANVAEHFQPCNGYTTCMWHNLLTCKILYDRDGRLAAAKARFNIPYPPQLKANIIARGRDLLHASMPAYRLQIEKAVKRGDLVSVNHRTAAFLESYFDVLFALNEQTHPGEKRMIQLCKERCPLLPERFEENLNDLFRDLFTTPQRVPAHLETILQGLETLLKAKI